MCALWTDFNHKPRSHAKATCVYFTFSICFFLVFFINTFHCFLPRVLHACPVFEMHYFHVYFTAICVAAKITMSKKKKKSKRSISLRYWLSFKRCHPPQPRTHVVFTGRLRVDLIPAMYLVLFNSSPRLRDKQPKGSICSNVLTTFMNFSSAAQGDGLPAGWVEEMRRPFDAADHTHNPPVG